MGFVAYLIPINNQWKPRETIFSNKKRTLKAIQVLLNQFGQNNIKHAKGSRNIINNIQKKQATFAGSESEISLFHKIASHQNYSSTPSKVHPSLQNSPTQVDRLRY